MRSLDQSGGDAVRAALRLNRHRFAWLAEPRCATRRKALAALHEISATGRMDLGHLTVHKKTLQK